VLIGIAPLRLGKATTLDSDSEVTEKINELLGAVAALKAYVAHLPGAADVDLDEVRRSARDTGPGLTGGMHPSTHVNDTIDDIYRMASALRPATE
jgi:hypothetical protein